MSDRSAIVTGASRGIGLATALMLAQRGYALTISGRDEATLLSAAERMRAAGSPHVQPVAGDLADEAALESIVSTHAAANSGLSAMVLNAGVGTAGSIANLPLRRLDKTFAVNWRAPYVLLQHALPLLRADARAHCDRAARVVVMSSIAGVYAEAGLTAYGASKAALMSLVDGINAEEAPNGVLATAIAPGYVATDMSAWVQETIPAEQMLSVGDIVVLVEAILSLSRSAVVPRMVVSRAASGGYIA